MSMSLYETFLEASFSDLLNQAKDYLFQYESVNDPYGKGRNEVFSRESFTCVRATPDGRVDFNFASRGIQSLMVQELPNVEVLLDVALTRMCASRGYASAGGDVCLKLSEETAAFLDSLRGEGPLDADEIRDFALDSVSAFFAPSHG